MKTVLGRRIEVTGERLNDAACSLPVGVKSRQGFRSLSFDEHSRGVFRCGCRDHEHIRLLRCVL